jgi:hypothetical protein
MPSESESESVRKGSERVEAKGKYGGEVRDTLFRGGGGDSILLLEVSQAMHARLYDKDRMRE